MRPLAAYIRSLDPRLTREVWLLQVGGLVNAFGNGIVIPFLIIYLHNVRGIPLGLAGLIAASNSAAALVSGFVAGTFADRVGPRRVLVVALFVMTGAILLFPLIRTAWHAAALNALLGAGSGSFWPSQSSMLAGLAPRERRQPAFALQRMTMNLGAALGGLTGGLIARSSEPHTFTILFVIDAATFLGYTIVLLQLPAPKLREEHEHGTYRDLARDRTFLGYTLLNATFITAAMAVVTELLPPFAKNDAGVSEKGVGAIWFVASAVIVVAQLPVAKVLEGHRRMRGLALMGALFAVSLLVMGAAGAWTTGIAATAIMAAAIVVFALGECLHGSIHVPLTVDLARPGLVGRYLALSSQSWQVGWIVGPAGGGFVLQHAPLALWPLAAGLNVVGAVGALALEPRLPRAVRKTPRGAEPLVPVEG